MQLPTKAEQNAITEEFLCSDAVEHLQAYSAYFKLYTSLLCPSASECMVVQVDDAIFKTHEDLLKCAKRIRAGPKLTRRQFEHASFPQVTSAKDLEDATRTVVRVGFMLDCLLKDKYSRDFNVEGYSLPGWGIDEKFENFVNRAIPRQSTQLNLRLSGPYKTLKAWKLKERQKLKFRPTDNIMEHLLYDPATRIVRVFHHTAYVKAHLTRTLNEKIDLNLESSLKLGSFPPQLLLETLSSFYDVLFPISTDAKKRSRRMLLSLIRKHGFDPNSKWDEGHVRNIPKDFVYVYWGARLARLDDIVKNPPPKNRFVSWIERHTSERNALTVALIGLFLSALFGLLGVIVGLAQLWITILAWKYPAHS